MVLRQNESRRRAAYLLNSFEDRNGSEERADCCSKEWSKTLLFSSTNFVAKPDNYGLGTTSIPFEPKNIFEWNNFIFIQKRILNLTIQFSRFWDFKLSFKLWAKSKSPQEYAWSGMSACLYMSRSVIESESAIFLRIERKSMWSGNSEWWSTALVRWVKP